MAEKKTPDISRYTFDPAESIFKDFEPYHCGMPAITEGFVDFELDPEKCDETNNFQSFKANGYTDEVLTVKTGNEAYNSYKSNGQLIKGCKKGTVILGDHPDHGVIIASGSEDVTIEVDGTENKLIITSPDWNESRTFDVNYFTTKGLVFPKRLGIMLVGGGGGAGGGSWYDNKKDGTHNDIVYCSGGSGGGGGIIWGVINIEYSNTFTIETKTKTIREWFIKIIIEELHITQEEAEKRLEFFSDELLEATLRPLPGKGGENANTDGLTHNHPNKGTAGYRGYDTTLYSGEEKIAVAYGGGGGRCGHWESTAGGGYGGDAAVYDKACFLDAKKLTGMPGINTKNNMEPASIPARDFRFEFMEDNTENGDYSYKIDLDSHQAMPAADVSARIPGGHSLGSGAYQDNAAGYGGGGCSNGGNGSNDGGKGRWIIFYA